MVLLGPVGPVALQCICTFRELLRKVVNYCFKQAERLDEVAGQIAGVSLD